MPLPGNVVSIRVNTKDTMSVIDLVETLGVPMHALSFPAMVSLALASMLEAMRQQGTLPERTGFEYLQMTQGILGTGQNKKKRAATKSILEMGSELQVKAPESYARKERFVYSPVSAEVEVPFQNGTEVLPPVEVEPTSEQMAQRKRLAELVTKLDQWEEKVPGITWTAADLEEYKLLERAIYG